MRYRPAAAVLATVWAGTLLLLAGGALWLELSYTPPPPVATPEEAAEGTAEGVDTAAPAEGASSTGSEGGPVDGTGGAGPAQDRPAARGDPQPAPASSDAAARAGEGDTRAPADIRLAEAPVSDLVEPGPDGLLPVAGEAGRTAWQVYSRPHLADPDAPRIALVVQEIGLNESATEATIAQLPPAVTLALSAYAAEPQAVARRARAAGHELLLMVPMEPFDYPANDPGPHTLLAGMPPEEMLARLHYVMGRFAGYVGLVNHMGSRFTADAQALAPVMADLSGRGVLFLDARASARSVLPAAAREARVPVVVNDRYIDNDVSGEAIDRQLDELLRIARAQGAAVGIGRPYPVTLRRIAAFAERLETEGAALAPVSALVGLRNVAESRAARP